MKSIRQVLEGKSSQIVSVAPADTVLRALELMAEHDIGAVMVVDGDKLVGIFSERDYARKIALHGKTARATLIGEAMTDKVLFVSPEQTVSQCLALMTERRFRHLPVLDSEQKILGIVSIGDLVKERISEQSFIIAQMERYIAS